LKPLTIELTKGAKRQLQSVGWKTAKENDCRRHFLVLDENDKPFVVMPKVAMADFYDPLRRTRAVFSCEPFPEAVCVEISPCRVHPPPCYESQIEFESQLRAHPMFEPWKWIYWQTHHEVLTLKPEDDGPLKERLDNWLADARQAYEYHANGWRTEIMRLETSTLEQLHFATESERDKRIGEAKARLVEVESESPIEGVPCKGRLKLTLGKVKLGHEGIRDAWMHEQWAAKNGEDLGVMRRERHAFRRWLETHTGTPALVFDSTTRERRQQIAPPSFGERFENNPKFLEACAQVRYRARFADNANTVVYLADCELREEPTAEERDEVARLTKLPKLKEPIPWHSDGFATIRRLNRRSGLIETFPLANEFRALCQLLCECHDQTAQYSEIEPHIGTRTHELDIAAGVTKPAQKGGRRVRDLLRSKTGKRLRKWGVLKVRKVGREKFVKLSRPRPAK
jgi:hypothetical protein